MRVNILSDGRFLNSGRFRPITNVRAAFTHQGKHQAFSSSPRDNFLAAFMDAYDLNLGEDDPGEDIRDTGSTPSGKRCASVFTAGHGSNDNLSVAAGLPAKVRLQYRPLAKVRATDTRRQTPLNLEAYGFVAGCKTHLVYWNLGLRLL
jgi:hypothetical protein